MAPKKSAFRMFMGEYNKNQIAQGKPPTSFKELPWILSPIWSKMTEGEKKKYEDLAYEENNQIKKCEQNVTNINNTSYDYTNVYKDVHVMIDSLNDKNEVLSKKFVLLHVNCHSHFQENYFFPAEIAALEFNLSDGVSRTYHQIIGCSKIYPRGYAGSMLEHSNLFHQISCLDKHPDDYKNILMDFIKFLINEEFDCNDLHKGTLNLPYLFSLETDEGVDIMKVKSSLDKLYATVYPDYDAKQYKSLFKISNVERLVLEIKAKLNLHFDANTLRSGMSACDIVESDMYGFGLGCAFHELKEYAFKCSKARVFQWMSNICKHVNALAGIHIVPGKHVPIVLSDGSMMIIQNSHLPLSTKELHLVIHKT